MQLNLGSGKICRLCMSTDERTCEGSSSNGTGRVPWVPSWATRMHRFWYRCVVRTQPVRYRSGRPGRWNEPWICPFGGLTGSLRRCRRADAQSASRGIHQATRKADKVTYEKELERQAIKAMVERRGFADQWVRRGWAHGDKHTLRVAALVGFVLLLAACVWAVG